MAVTWKKLAYADNVILKSLLTEQGDIIYASAASTPAALPHGTSSQYLKSGGHGANPSWDTPAGGGATLTIAETQVFSGQSPTTFTDLDLSGTIGAQATLVVLKVYCADTLNAHSYGFRRNGDTDSQLYGTVVKAKYGVYIAVTSTAGVIEWIDDTAKAGTTIDVIAYIK